MKKGYVRALLTPDFEKSSIALAKAELLGTASEPLIRLIAQVFDYSLAEGDAYINIGLNRQKSAVVLTLTVEGEKTYAIGADLPSFLLACQDLL